MIRPHILIFSLIASCISSTVTGAQGTVCTPGQVINVVACDQPSVIAHWNQDRSVSCTYNPPPGYAILSHSVQVLSSNDGSQAVSIVAGHSNFATSSDYSSAYNYALDILGKYVDQEGQKSDEGRLATKRNALQNEAAQFSASNNTLYAVAQASGNGNPFNQTRGWETITVNTKLKYIGVNDVLTLANQLIKTSGIILGKRIKCKKFLQ